MKGDKLMPSGRLLSCAQLCQDAMNGLGSHCRRRFERCSAILLIVNFGSNLCFCMNRCSSAASF